MGGPLKTSHLGNKYQNTNSQRYSLTFKVAVCCHLIRKFEEGGVAQIRRKLHAKFAQSCCNVFSYITRRVRKILANLAQI